MAKELYKEAEIFTAAIRNQADIAELNEARETMRQLANLAVENNDAGIANEFAQISTVIVNEIYDDTISFIETFADMQSVGYNEKLVFEYDVDLTEAQETAKGVAAESSTVARKYSAMKTTCISTTPTIRWMDLKSGRVKFDDIARNAVRKLDEKTQSYVYEKLVSKLTALSAPNFNTGTGVDTAVLKSMINTFGRFGEVSLVGDIEGITQITDIAGFSDKLPEELAVEHNVKGYVGVFNTANVIKLKNPYIKNSLTDTVFARDILLILPTPSNTAARPLKVGRQGGVEVRTKTDFDTGDFTTTYLQLIGADLVYASVCPVGAYKILTA